MSNKIFHFNLNWSIRVSQNKIAIHDVVEQFENNFHDDDNDDVQKVFHHDDENDEKQRKNFLDFSNDIESHRELFFFDFDILNENDSMQNLKFFYNLNSHVQSEKEQFHLYNNHENRTIENFFLSSDDQKKIQMLDDEMKYDNRKDFFNENVNMRNNSF